VHSDFDHPVLFCYENNEIQPQGIECSSKSSESVNGDKVFQSEDDMCKGNTAAGGSGVLWTGREFGVRICVEAATRYNTCDEFRKDFLLWGRFKYMKHVQMDQAG
jgi:hypothetical protein